MRRLRPLWMREPDYFPELEVIGWPRLDEVRRRHADSLEVYAAIPAGDEQAAEEMVRALCTTVERGVDELAANWAELEEAQQVAAVSAVPRAREEARGTGVESVADRAGAAAETNRTINREQAGLKDRRQTIANSDVPAINGLRRRILEPTVMHDGEIKAQVRAEIANERARVEKARANREAERERVRRDRAIADEVERDGAPAA